MLTKDLIDETACAKCGCKYFKMYFKIGKVSAIKSPVGKEMTVRIPIYRCVDCNTYVCLSSVGEIETGG